MSVLQNREGIANKPIIEGGNVLDAALKGGKGGVMQILPMAKALDSASEAMGSLTSKPLPTAMTEVDMHANHSKSPSFRGR